jgi:hypothetical protein
MVFTTTSIKRKCQGGFTLVELLVTSVTAGLVLLALASLTFYTGRSFSSLANYVDLDNYSRKALDTMTREIRQTNKLLSATTNKLTFQDYDGGELAYTFDSNAKTLVRSKNGVSDADPLLKECTFLQFSIFQRNPVAGTYNQYPTATAATCKLVQLKWICSRSVIRTVNTESVQSAKIVIRKQ